MSHASLAVRLGVPATALVLRAAMQESAGTAPPAASPAFSLLELSAAGLLPQIIATDGKYSWLFGVFLAAMASIISNLGLTFQKLTHQRIANGYGRVNRPYYLHPLWVIGLLLVMLASLADVIALCFAPQSLIAPLGALTMVSNVVFAPLLLHEKIGVRDLIATAIILSGSIICVIFGAHEDTIYRIGELFGLFADPRFIAYAVCVGVGVLSFFTMLQIFAAQEERHKNGQGDPLTEVQRHWQRFAYPAIAGGIGAQSVLFAKCTVELLINTGRSNGNAFHYWQTYLILAAVFATIFLQIKWLNDGLIRFDTSYIVPVFVSFWIILSVMSGMIFFKEYAGMSWTQIGLFGVGVACTIAGVVLLSFRPITAANASRGTTAFDFDDDQEEEDAPLASASAGAASAHAHPHRRSSAEHERFLAHGVGGADSSSDSMSVATEKEHLNGTLAQRRATVHKSRPTSPARSSRSLAVGGGIGVSASESIDSSADDPAEVARRQQEEDAADRSDDEEANDHRSLLDRGAR